GPSEVWEWDGTNWTKITPPTRPDWRELEGSAYDGARRRVMMFGGEDCPEFCITYNDTWMWNGGDWTQRHPASPPAERSSMWMAYDAARQRVVMFGGDAVDVGFTNQTWTWDGRAWTLQAPATSPPARERMGLAWDGARRQIVMFGGRPPDYNDFDDTWV